MLAKEVSVFGLLSEVFLLKRVLHDNQVNLVFFSMIGVFAVQLWAT